MDEIKTHIFFIPAESHVKGVKIYLEKNRFFSFRGNIVETMRNRKKCFK